MVIGISPIMSTPYHSRYGMSTKRVKIVQPVDFVCLSTIFQSSPVSPSPPFPCVSNLCAGVKLFFWCVHINKQANTMPECQIFYPQWFQWFATVARFVLAQQNDAICGKLTIFVNRVNVIHSRG